MPLDRTTNEIPAGFTNLNLKIFVETQISSGNHILERSPCWPNAFRPQWQARFDIAASRPSDVRSSHHVFEIPINSRSFNQHLVRQFFYAVRRHKLRDSGCLQRRRRHPVSQSHLCSLLIWDYGALVLTRVCECDRRRPPPPRRRRPPPSTGGG